MTTEQMDWLDDERAGRHKSDPRLDAGLKPVTEYHVRVNGGEPTVMTTDAEEHTHYTREARDQCAAGDHKYARLLDEAAEREKIKAHEPPPGWFYFGTHAGVDVKLEFSEAQDEVGDPLWERPIHSVSAEDYVTMAEEPIEIRLQRAFLNGFKEGVDRAAFATQEATGRWDY